MSLEQADGIFLMVQSLDKLVGRKLVWEDYQNEIRCAGALNGIGCQLIENAEFTIESIHNGSMTVYWKGHCNMRLSSPFHDDVPFEARATIPLPESELEESHKNPSGSDSAEYSVPVETHNAFVRQIADWYSGGELPGAAGQDLRFILELQKQKLHSLGLEMKCAIPKNDPGRSNVTGIYYSDRLFSCSTLVGDVNVTRSIVGIQDQHSLNASDATLVTLILEPKEKSQPDDSMTLCCPNCGAPSTLGELRAGCKHCDTHFRMSKLYPKVMNYSASENDDAEKRKRKNRRDLHEEHDWVMTDLQ